MQKNKKNYENNVTVLQFKLRDPWQLPIFEFWFANCDKLNLKDVSIGQFVQWRECMLLNVQYTLKSKNR